MKPLEGQRPLSSRALFGKSPNDFDHLVDPYDASHEVAKRARSYLHSNCAYCHIEAGGGNAKMNLSIYASLEQMGIVQVAPIHHSFGKQDAKLIAPRSAEQSVLIHRVGLRGMGQMPQLGTNEVDEKGLQLLKDWVHSMK